MDFRSFVGSFRFAYTWRANLRKDILTVAVILSGAIAVAWTFFRIGFSETNLVMIYLLGVILVSLRTQWLYGIVVSVASVLLFNFLFIEPLYTFSVHDPEYPFTFAVMPVVTLVTSRLTTKVKQQAEIAAERERRTNVLYGMGRAILKVNGIPEVISAALVQMKSTMPGTAVVYLKEGAAVKRFALAEGPEIGKLSITVPAERNDPVLRTLENGKPSGVGSDRFETLPAFYLPLPGANGIYGVYVYYLEETSGRLNAEERSLIETLAARLALALDRELITIRHAEIKLRAENEKLRTALLRSISHDLRTPLARITGASSTLIENGRNLDEDQKNELLTGIYEESTRLSGLVDNLLSLSKVQNTEGMIRKTPEVIDDVPVSAVQRVRKRLGAHELSLHEPDDLILVPMDGSLIEQVLINLMDNAVRHTPDGTRITVSARVRDGGERRFAEFSVEDTGRGIPADSIGTLFEPYRSNNGERGRSARGAGLGLSICRAIVEAHGGSISVENASTGGADFRFLLPIDAGSDAENGITEAGNGTAADIDR